MADLIETLRITRMRPRRGVGGRWVHGRIGDHSFEALVFPEHADHPEWELDQSRISKLWVRRISDRHVVVSFDRGWDIRPQTETAAEIADLLAGALAEVVFD